MIDANARARELLTEPFPEEVIRVRPDVYCMPCIKGGACWQGHQVTVCQTCGEQVSTAHVHVEYIPHEYVRDLLDQVDPDWSCVPAAVDGHGMPLLDQGCLWVRLTVAGKTVYGVGDGQGKTGSIGRQLAFTYAFKHAAEQLGVGRYLRQRERERPPIQQLPALKSAEPPAPAGDAGDAGKREHLLKRIVERGTRKGMSPADIDADFRTWSQTPALPGGVRLHEASIEQMGGYLELLGGRP